MLELLELVLLLAVDRAHVEPLELRAHAARLRALGQHVPRVLLALALLISVRDRVRLGVRVWVRARVRGGSYG